MAGGFREAAARSGRWALSLSIILVMAFWFGGGLLAGTLVPRILHQLAEVPGQAARMAGSIQFWFSTTVIIATAVLAAAVFFLERRRKSLWILLAAMALVAILNQYVIEAWLGHTAEGPRETLGRIYAGIYFFQAAAAFGFVAVLARSGRERPLPAEGGAPPESPAGAAPAASPEAPGTIGNPSPERAAVVPAGTISPAPPVLPAAPFPGEAGLPPASPFESPERPFVEPPPPPREEIRPAGPPAGEDGGPDPRS